MRGERTDRLPGWLRVTLGTAGDLVLFAALSLVIWTVLPAIALGATPIIISGGSMSPLIRAGDVVLLDDTSPPDGEMFAAGTVITFERTDGDAAGALVTHRVTGLEDGNYLTRGDANDGNDPRPVAPDQIVGAGRWLVPVVGLPLHWGRTGAWHLVLATVACGFAAVGASIAGSTRRVAVEQPDEVEEELPLDTPVEPAPLEPVPTLAAEEVLPTSDDAPERPAAAAKGTREPADAQRVATIAAQAARRGLAGVGRVAEEDERRASDDDLTGGTAGSAPLASILALASALVLATIVPSVSAAAFVATTSNAGNSFAVAPAQDLNVLLTHPAAPVLDSTGNPNGFNDHTFDTYVTEAPVRLLGRPSITFVLQNPKGGAHTPQVEFELEIAGETLTASLADATAGSHTLQFDQELDVTLPTGTDIDVAVRLRRVDLAVDESGPTITFPG